MTARPTPTAVHPDRAHPVSSVLRDRPASEFFALMERRGAPPDLLTSLRTTW